MDLVSALIRFDTSNTGELATTKGEAECARWVAEQLEEVGFETEYVESGAPGRGNVFARLKGADPARGALMLHGHLDVVPAEAVRLERAPVLRGRRGRLRVGPRRGRHEGHGRDDPRGRPALQRSGIVPPRDLVFAFVSDEEAGGNYGCKWLVENRPDLFDGVTEAVGEVGGFSLTVPRRDGGERRLYLIETAEKAMMWMRLTARGRAGHGSIVHDDNAVTAVAEAVAKLGRHQFPIVLTESVEQFLAAVSEETGYTFDPTSPDIDGAVAKLGSIAKIVGRHAARHRQPDDAQGRVQGQRHPATAEAVVDCRVLPGRLAEFEREVDEVIGPDVTREWITELPSYETPFDGELLEAMNDAILAADPEARIVPYMLSGGTDAKHFARLGIRCFGFAPLRLPPDLDFAALFHGVDERVPVDALTFGAQVLEHFLLHC